MFTRKPRLRPGEFLITSAKRLLQQYLPKPDSRTATKRGYCVAAFRPSLDVQKSHAPIPGDRLSCIGRFGNQRLLGETPIDDQMASRRGRSCRAKSACEPEDRSRS